tara:strand:- start:456 stop:902 length:447 start_codon:yes stop_codon:yes gene_type:complete
MVYLYAGLGIAMISGISAMVQIGANLNNMSPLSALKANTYSGKLPTYDRQIMKILYSQSVPSSQICSYIKESIQNPVYEDGDIFDETKKQTYSKNILFSESCVLVSNEAKHRVLIIPKTGENFKYGFFSCSISQNSYCDFEMNPNFKE